MSWRKRAAAIIAIVLAENEGGSEETIRAALHERYPFGPRRMYPYRVWLDEIKRQRHLPRGKPKPPGALLAMMEDEDRC